MNRQPDEEHVEPFIDIDTSPNSMPQPLHIKYDKIATNSDTDLKRLDNNTPVTPNDYRLDYEVFHWIFIIFFTLVAVIDRFTLNLWPLWVDSPGPTIPGNVAVSVFSLTAWISSRMMLVSCSYIFLFECNVFWNWFVEHKFPNKYLKIACISQSNITLHYHVGWALIGLPVLLHVWAIVFASASPQNDAKLYNSWMRPNDENGNSIPFYADNLLSLAINDVYRIASTSVTFFILMPYSIISICRNRNWSRAQYIHLLGALIFTVDLIRMKSHPHCWVFNAPFIIWWMADRLYGVLFYRRSVAKLVNRVDLDGKYAIMYLRLPASIRALRTIGDVFYVNFIDPKWDRAHPFTAFWNHQRKAKMILDNEELAYDWAGHKFLTYRGSDDHSISEYVMSRQSTKAASHSLIAPPCDGIPETCVVEREDETRCEYNWDIGIIMSIHPNRTGCDPRKTWTSEAVTRPLCEILGFKIWGPYRSEYRVLMKEETNAPYPSTSLVLIGTGAGCAYLVDFHQYISSHNIALDKKVYMCFSTRSLAMFQWFTDITCHEYVPNLSVNAHLTSHDNVRHKEKELKTEAQRSRSSAIGRLDIEQIFERSESNANVFYCGSPIVQNVVHNLCKKYKFTFHQGQSFY